MCPAEWSAPVRALTSPHGLPLINCSSSFCDSDHFDQDSWDIHPCPIHQRNTPLALCTSLAGYRSMAIIRKFSPTSNPSLLFFSSCLYLATTNNLTSAPLSPCRWGIMSLYGKEVLEQKQEGLKQHDMQQVPPCVFTHALVTGWDKAPLSQVNTKAQRGKMARLTLDLLCT